MAKGKKYPLAIVLSTVDKSTEKLRKINKSFDRLKAPVNKLRRSLKMLSKEAGLGKFAAKIKSVGKTMALSLTGAVAAVGAFVTKVSEANVKTERLAKSVGLNVRTLEALGAQVKTAGFDFEHVVDLVEEMNNKLGESAGLEEITPVTESLHILGLEFENIRRLKPEEQFEQIVDAALRLDDAQEAASAVDILMGGEANKIIGLMRETGKSYSEIIELQDKYNFRSEEGRAGMRRWMDVLTQTQIALGSLAAEIAGVTGGSMADLLAQFNEWLVLNREGIAEKIKTFAASVREFFGYLRDNQETVIKFAKAIGVLAVALTGLLVLGSIAGAIAALANPIGAVVAVVTALTVALGAMGKWFSDHWGNIKETIGGILDAAKSAFSFGGLFGGSDDESAAAAAVGGTVGVTNTNNAGVKIDIDGLRPGDKVTSTADAGMPFSLNQGYAMVP